MDPWLVIAAAEHESVSDRSTTTILRRRLIGENPRSGDGKISHARSQGQTKWTTFFRPLSPRRRGVGWRLLQGPLRYPSTSDEASARRSSCRASSTTGTAGSADSPLASPPKSPDDRVV